MVDVVRSATGDDLDPRRSKAWAASYLVNDMAKPVFTANRLTKTYVSGEVIVHALNDVDLRIEEKEVVVLLGPSGSGKTTLLNIMGGLDHPTSGKLLFRDLELTGLDDCGLTKYRREHVGFVFQFYNLVPSLTAYENVALVTEISRQPMRPDEALALVGLETRMRHFPAQLSGGEQQRVAIARAIAKRPAVLLCDEPTGALDSKTGIRVIEALLSVNRQLGTTTVIITHNASIQEVADRVLFFADGRISRIQKNDTRREAAALTW
jgi:putative ABC transport system ATP-binding protein